MICVRWSGKISFENLKQQKPNTATRNEKKPQMEHSSFSSFVDKLSWAPTVFGLREKFCDESLAHKLREISLEEKSIFNQAATLRSLVLMDDAIVRS